MEVSPDPQSLEPSTTSLRCGMTARCPSPASACTMSLPNCGSAWPKISTSLAPLNTVALPSPPLCFWVGFINSLCYKNTLLKLLSCLWESGRFCVSIYSRKDDSMIPPMTCTHFKSCETAGVEEESYNSDWQAEMALSSSALLWVTVSTVTRRLDPIAIW